VQRVSVSSEQRACARASGCGFGCGWTRRCGSTCAHGTHACTCAQTGVLAIVVLYLADWQTGFSVVDFLLYAVGLFAFIGVRLLRVVWGRAFLCGGVMSVCVCCVVKSYLYVCVCVRMCAYVCVCKHRKLGLPRGCESLLHAQKPRVDTHDG